MDILGGWKFRFTASLLLALALPSTLAAAGTSFGGIVRDSSGRLLEQVEIFLFDEPVGSPPLTERLSDEEGRFDLGELVPGAYRLAAVKEGYRLYLGRVDTLMQRSIQVILQPMPGKGEAGTEIVPGNASWSLRLPRRSLLRETGAEVLAPGRLDAEALEPRNTGAGRALSGEVAHTFEARSSPGADSRQVDAYGLHTSLNMTAIIDEHARLQIDGNRLSVDRATAGYDLATGTRTDVSAGLHLDAGADDRINIRTRFGGLETDLDGAGPKAVAWGYDARWDRQLDGASRFGLRMAYRDGSAGEADIGLSDPVAGRRAVAGGYFEALVAPGHQVRTAIEANQSRHPDTVYGPDTWNIRLQSEDAWAVTVPLTLVYGLEYRLRHGYQASGLFRPKIGAAWAGSAFALRGVLVGAMSPGSPDGAIGYEAEIEVPLPGGFRFLGAWTRDPNADQLPEGETGLQGDLVRSYGELVYGGRLVALVRDGASGRIALTWRDGDLYGLLGTVPDLESPLLVWDEETLRFENLDLALVFPSTGTELTVGVRETTMGPGEMESAGERQNNRYSIYLKQDLYRPARGASWRLAVALIAQDQAAGRRGPFAETEEVTRYSMLNAGVSVVF
jgi:hypothetical protein